MKLLPLLLVLALAPGAFAHSGEWGAMPPPVTYPPDPLPKWPGPHTMAPKNTPGEAPRRTGRRAPRGTTRSGWSRWWNLHRERILGPGPNPPALAAKEREAVLAALRKALGDESVEVRTSAIVALGRARDVTRVPHLVKLLRAKTTPVSELQSSLLALGLLGAADEETRVLVRGMLASDRWSTEVRSYAAYAIGFAGGESGRAALAARLADPKTAAGLRAAAAAALGLLGADEAGPALAKALDAGHETNPGVRAFAAASLASVSAGEGRTALMQTLDDFDLGVARQSALSLGAYSDPWARKALLDALSGGDDPVTRAYAGLALADAGDLKALEPLAKAAADSDAVLAAHSAVALGLLARRAKSGAAKARVQLLIAARLNDVAGNDLTGALAAAGALAGAKSLAGRYAELLPAGGDPEVRGHAAFAFGLLGGDEAALLPLIAPGTPIPLLREVGLVTARRGSTAAAKRFRDLLAADGPESSRCLAAVTLGRFPGGADALVAILADRSQPELVRGCAAVGLGRRLETARPSPLALTALRLSPELVGGPVREVISMR
ncbi:MAG: HEAT repeat domain-containing protein [Planctomycetota bacterium]